MKKIKKYFNKIQEINKNHFIGITNFNKLNYDLIKCPDFQRVLNNEKVKEIEEHIKNNHLFPIISLEIGYLYDEFYLIDGQHRFCALKNVNLNKYLFEVHLTIVNSNNELKRLFELINKNTAIPDEWLLINNMNTIKTNMIKIFEDKTMGTVIKTSIKPHRPNISRQMIENMITSLYKKNIEIEIKHFLELNDIYQTYNFNNFPNTTGKQNDELWEICKNKNCYLGLIIKNNNYDILKDDLIKIYRNQKPDIKIYETKKPKIPKAIKVECWKRYLKQTKQDKYEIKCPINFCSNLITSDNFECGHIISHANNGKINLDNLKPICRTCNASMSSKNWNDFDK